MVNETKPKRLNIHLKDIAKESTEYIEKYKKKCDSFSYATFQLVKIELKVPDLLRPLIIFKNWKTRINCYNIKR